MRFKGGGKQYPLSLGVIERTREGLLGKNFGWGLEKLGWRRCFRSLRVMVSCTLIELFRQLSVLLDLDQLEDFCEELKKWSLNRESLSTYIITRIVIYFVRFFPNQFRVLHILVNRNFYNYLIIG